MRGYIRSFTGGREPLMWVLAASIVLAAGCALKSPPDAASLKAEALGSMQIPSAWAATATTGNAPADNWLASYADPQLSAAVAEAMVHNADLRVGAARVEQSLLQARLAGARLYPSVDVLARGGGKMSGDNSGLTGGVLTVGWELDLWGRVRYGRAAARADAASTQADFEFARQSLAAHVATSWFLVAEAGLHAELARRTVGDAETLMSLANDRARVGVGTEEEVVLARAAVGTYRDNLRQIELAREQATRALESLLGRYPLGVAAVTPQLPTQRTDVPAGLPSQLLERRPDVIAAERRVAAAFNRIGEAKAARLPVIGLTAGVSTISSDLFVLQSRDNPVWNLGANLLVPVFRGGALKRQVEIRTAEQKQAVATYAAVGLQAFGEVEGALSAEIAAHDREHILTGTLADNRRALEILQSQFAVGRTDLRFVIERQLAVLATESALIRVQAEQRVQRVNLHLALGGSFAPRP